MSQGSLPDDAAARNAIPLADGVLYYFPNALAEVAKVSKAGNDQHNPGQPMHWARGKSTDHENKILRHLVDAGKRDSKGIRHSAYLAWRALALLQEEIERDEGAPLPRNARAAETSAGAALDSVSMAPPIVEYDDLLAADAHVAPQLVTGSSFGLAGTAAGPLFVDKVVGMAIRPTDDCARDRDATGV